MYPDRKMYFRLEGQHNLNKLYPNKIMWHRSIVDNEGENAIDSKGRPCVLVALSWSIEELQVERNGSAVADSKSAFGFLGK